MLRRLSSECVDEQTRGAETSQLGVYDLIPLVPATEGSGGVRDQIADELLRRVDLKQAAKVAGYDYAGQDALNGFDLSGTCYDWRNSLNPVAYNRAVAGRRGVLCRQVQGLAQVCLTKLGGPLSNGSINGCYRQAQSEICAKSMKSCKNLWRHEKLNVDSGPSGQELLNISCTVTDIPFGRQFISNLLSWIYSALACPEPAN